MSFLLKNLKKTAFCLQKVLQKMSDASSFEAELKKTYRALLPEIREEEIGNPMTIWDKPAVVFFHLGKTGGSTLFHWLCQYFHPLQICPTPNGGVNIPSSTEVFLKYKFISGHTRFSKIQAFPHPNKTIITMLRDPKKRIYSAYCYASSLKSEAGNAVREAAKTHDFKSFLKLREKIPGIKERYENYYLRKLTSPPRGRDFLSDNPEASIALAKNALDQIAAVGILEEFPASILLFSKILGLGDVDPQQIVSRNVLSKKEPSEKLGMPKAHEIDEETLSLMEECTRYDQVLYEYAKQIFARQCKENL